MKIKWKECFVEFLNFKAELNYLAMGRVQSEEKLMMLKALKKIESVRFTGVAFMFLKKV